MHIVTIVGARPQFIKAAPVSRALAATGTIQETIVHTGQHYDASMSEVFFSQLGIPTPAFNLELGGGAHGSMTGRMIIALEEVLDTIQPDRVLVYGDTNSTLAGALAAAKLKIPITHVEAGLRAYDRSIPEEINRVMTDHLSDQLFAATTESVKNLQNEGIPNAFASVEWVGDVMLDAVLQHRQHAAPPTGVTLPAAFILATVHRAENTDDPSTLIRLVTTLNDVHANVLPVVMPLHPRTRKAIAAANLSLNAITLPPTGYLETLYLLDHAAVVMTDSGGMQKEAYYFGKRCVTLRAVTEWPELARWGVNTLVGSDPRKVHTAVTAALHAGSFVPDLVPYGNGHASTHIAERIKR